MSEPEMKLDVSAMIPRLTEEIAAELRKKAVDSFQYEVQRSVQEEIRKYIEKNIVPAIQKELAEAEVTIRAAFLAAIKESVTIVGQSVVESTKKKLTGWEGEKLVESVLRLLVGRP